MPVNGAYVGQGKGKAVAVTPGGFAVLSAAGIACGACADDAAKTPAGSATLAAILRAARRYIRLFNSSASKSDNTCRTSECV